MRKARIVFNLVRADLDEFIIDSEAMDAKVERYLPSNYFIGETYTADDELRPKTVVNYVVEIWGEDNAGWTLDGYVIPRLASGLIFAEEIK